jgi:alkylation response protein AidB-like acyl-CoA dehydrogenase
MDWSPGELQREIAPLAKQILRTAADPWQALAEAGLLELEELPDICTFIEQVGRAGGGVPALETLLLGGPARGDAFPPDAILTGALTEPGVRLPDTSSATVVRDGRCTTVRQCVPAATTAVAMVFAAEDGLYVVELSSCQVTAQQRTDGGDQGIVVLEDVPVRRLGDCAAVTRWRQRADVGLAALQLGLAREALVMTAKYTSGREQFGRPIATFQAVSQRAADGWIEVQAMELTMLQAAWRVEAGLPSEREVAIARYQASEGAHRVLATAQHLHGGMGFDRDYPLHRYFLCVKAWEFAAGGASAQLERLGAHLAGSR